MSTNLKQSFSPIRSKENFLVFGAPPIGEDEIAEVVDSMRSGWLGTGPKVARFTEDFTKYKNVNYGVAVNSCTAALHLSIVAAGIGPGDEVITTPLTFCATVNSIMHAGATPVLADIDPVTRNIDPQRILEKITPRTKAVIPVHMAGHPCDMDAIVQIVKEHNLKLIEDCAHAIETEYKGTKAGNFGDFGCFSFYVTKNIVTGEGGMVTSHSAENMNRVKVLSLHGMSKDAWKRFGNEGYKHYQVVECGFKYNMMDLQAAIGIHQLKQVDTYWKRREEIWNSYNEAFRDLPIILPADPEPNTRHGYHLYTLLIDESKAGISRDDFLNAMTAHNIGVGVHYLSIPEHPYYQENLGWKPEDYPNAMSVGQRTVSLPLSARLTDEDVQDVINAVRLVILNRPLAN
ncbi:MAG: DegT/DnrJ/EryC1/StrS family aminotransferase [Elainellaceae cyanobacterium]